MFRAEDLSVVIPAYNHERFVAAALASIRDQSLRPREVVVVDDGSSDRTADVVVAVGLPDLTIVRQANQGAHAALNRAIALARGSWIAILNSDDAFAPARLERALGVARASGAALVVGRVRLIDEQGDGVPPTHPTAVWYEEALAALARAPSLAAAARVHNVAVTTSNFFFHRELWTRLGGFRAYRYVHDLDFLLRALALAPALVVFEETLTDVRYRVHPGNTITEDVERALAERGALLAERARPWRRAARALGWTPGRRRLSRAVAAHGIAAPPRPRADAGEPALRCGLIVERLDRGGLEAVVAALALLLPAHGIEPFILCTAAGGRTAERLARAGVPVRIETGRAGWRAWAEETRPQVVSAHFVGPQPLEEMAALRIPAVETVHNTYVWFGPHDWERERAKQQLLQAIIHVSRTAALYHARHVGRGVPRALVPNGVDPARVAALPRAYARRALGVTAPDRVCASVGRLCLQKNQIGLLAAFRDVLAAEPRALLLLMGNGQDQPYAAELRARGSDLIARGRLRLLPDGDEVATLLSAADAFVANSFFEGWSLAATEALCCGAPVVLSECGGSRQLIGREGARGFLVPNPAGDPLSLTPASLADPDAGALARNRTALTEAMLGATSGRFADEDCRDAIRRGARARFGAATMARAHAGVLRDLAAGRLPARARHAVEPA